MRHTLTFVILILLALSSHAQVKTSLTSPDGRLKVTVDADKQVIYSITDQGTPLLEQSVADIQLVGAKQHHFVSASKPRLFKETIEAPFAKINVINDEYTGITLKNANGLNIELRAYNSGIAYRWIVPSKSWIVSQETADFRFSGDYTAYLPYSTNPDKPKAMAFQATYDVAPLSQSKDLEAFLPATVDCKGAKVTLLETDVKGYPGMFVKGSKQMLSASFACYPKTFDFYAWRQQKYVTSTENFIAQGQAPASLPWRIIAVTHEDKEMPTHMLSYTLSSPSRIKDTSWITPGKVAWDWWNDWGISGVDFKAGINQDTYKYIIDFASQNHLEYIILDEGWYDPKSGDMLTVVPELDLPALVAYGQQRHVGIILWTVFNVLDSQLEEACQRYADMGIKGFKVDFLDRYDQEGVDMIYRIAERCADSHLMLDYHGIFAPQGIQRTWPNVVNFEAVFGMEEVKWTNRIKRIVNGREVEVIEKDMPAYDVTFPFIRGMAGYVDFTPGGMRNATSADFQPVYNNPMTMGTRCHQLAHYIVHDSPLTMLADNQTIYRQEQECTDFITSLPAVYDEMKVLDGKMGEYIVTARKKGADWYVAGETNWDERDITLDCQFLPAGTYDITLFMDGVNANKNACDYRVVRSRVSISPTSHESIAIHMASGGGFATKIVRIQ